jgi:peptide/nickel transport system permease protein
VKLRISTLTRDLSKRDKVAFYVPLVWLCAVVFLSLAAPLLTMRVELKELPVVKPTTVSTTTTVPTSNTQNPGGVTNLGGGESTTTQAPVTSTTVVGTTTTAPASSGTSNEVATEKRLVAVDPIIPIPGFKLKPWDRSWETVKETPSLRIPGEGPSGDHWLGTDELGRDILSRLIWGGRVALAVGIVSVLVAMVIGGTIGMLSGYLRGRTETFLMTIAGSLLAFPSLILVIAIVAFLGQDLKNIVLAIAVVAIPSFARISYANTLAASQREYVLAARSLGASRFRVLRREILPNIFLPLSAYALVVTAVAIVAEGGLAFLGLSVPDPQPSWGSMINDGRKPLTLDGTWHISFIPAIVMFLTVLSLNLIVDRIRQIAEGKESKL